MSNEQQPIEAHIKTAIGELTFAQYENNIKGMVCVFIDSQGQLRMITAFDTNTNVSLLGGLRLADDFILQTLKTNQIQTELGKGNE